MIGEFGAKNLGKPYFLTSKSVELYCFFQIIALGFLTILLTYNAVIFKQFMGARNRVGIGLLYRPARLHQCIGWRN